jgi:hypothetical protein
MNLEHADLGPRTRLFCMAPLLLAIATCAGCATIGYGAPVVVSERRVGTRTETRSTGKSHVVSDQNGSLLTISVTRVCEADEIERYEVTERRERTNQSATGDWVMAAAGVVSIGTGAVLVGDASSTYPDDTTSKSYNPTGPTKERVWGGVLLGVGALLAGAAGYDVISVQGGVDTKKEVERPGGAAKRNVPCGEGGVAEQTVELRAGADRFPLGHTDVSGKLSIDLVDVLPAPKLLPASRSAILFVGDESSRQVDLRPVVLGREKRDWDRLKTASCTNPSFTWGCLAVEGFLEDYPDSVHVDEARKLLEIGRPKIRVLKDHELWATMPVTACTDTKSASAADIDQACELVRGYLAAYPEGAHAAEAKRAVAAGDARSRRLREDTKNAGAAVDAAKARRQCMSSCQSECNAKGGPDTSSCFGTCVKTRCPR